MRKFDLKTKREAVDLALRRLVGMPATTEFMLGLEGMGWEGDFDEMRSSVVDEARQEGSGRLWPLSF